MFPSRQIANYFVQKSFDTGVIMTPMKVLKLSYIAHGWYLALAEKPLLSDAIEAWKYGPVIRSVYQDFKGYGKGQITELRKNFNYSTTDYNVDVVDNPDIIKFLDAIWQVYGKFSGVELSEMTHKKGTPWDIVWNDRGGCDREGAVIPNDLIEEHYKGLASKN